MHAIPPFLIIDTFDMVTPDNLTTSLTVKPDLEIAVTVICESSALFSVRAVSHSFNPKASPNSLVFLVTAIL